LTGLFFVNLREKNKMFDFLFKNKRLGNSAHKIFASIINQSRVSTFYSDYDVDDSLDGRFDLLALHMAFILDKLDQHDNQKDGGQLGRKLQEIMFDNLDLTLREIGVGDLGVGKKIKAMAEAFYGRMGVYKQLFNSFDLKKMAEALDRNLYREKTVNDETLNQMLQYVYDQKKYINEQSIENIISGKIDFINPREKGHD